MTPADLDHLRDELSDGDGDLVGDVDGGTVVSCSGADANGDGLITAADLSALTRLLYGETNATGPIVTFLGIVSADGTTTMPVTDVPVPLFQTVSGLGFRLVVEAAPGASQLPVGQDLLNSKPGDPTARPDLQIEASRNLGDGNPAVCGEGGVPGVDPPNYSAPQTIANALNDLSCRFDVAANPAAACTLDQFGTHGFVDPRTRAQFCLLISTVEGFQAGPTIVTARVLDTAGNPGPLAQIILQVGDQVGPTVTPRSTATPEPSPSNTGTATPGPSATITNTAGTTPTASVTLAATAAGTATTTRSAPATPTRTPTGPTAAGTQTPTASPSPTGTSSATGRATASATGTATLTRSPLSTTTPTATRTATRAFTNTAVATAIGTQTATGAATATRTPTPSATPTATLTRRPTGTATPSSSATQTSTVTASPRPTTTSTASATPSRTRPATVTATPTATVPPTQTATVTRTRTVTTSPTITRTASATFTLIPTRTPTATASSTLTGTATRTGTVTPTGTETRTPTSTRTPTRTRTSTSTQTPTPTPSATRTPTQTGTPTNTLRPGADVSYVGLALPSDKFIDPIPDTSPPVYQQPFGYLFTVVVEAKPGPSHRPVGLNAFNYDPNDPTVRPDLQIIVSRQLGDGSMLVCDDTPPIGGVPSAASFDVTQPISDAINDFACRFNNGSAPHSPGGRSAGGQCTTGTDGQPVFGNPSSTAQFCAGIAKPFGFQMGDTVVSVRVRDITGVPGPPASFIVRIQP